MSTIILSNQKQYVLHSLYIEESQKPNGFFAWCLKNKLYKESANPDFVSHMRVVYENRLFAFNGISAIVAMDDDKPVGICLLEHYKQDEHSDYILSTQAGVRHSDNRYRKNPWEKKMDWHFINMGFMSLYVKPSHRKKGLASHMVNEMQELQLMRLSQAIQSKRLPGPVISSMADNKLVVSCRELALKVVDKSNLFHPIGMTPSAGNYEKEISSLTQQILIEKSFIQSSGTKDLPDLATIHAVHMPALNGLLAQTRLHPRALLTPPTVNTGMKKQPF